MAYDDDCACAAVDGVRPPDMLVATCIPERRLRVRGLRTRSLLEDVAESERRV